MGRRGRLKGPMGSHERPASPLLFRLVLAVFGLVVLIAGAVLAAVAGSAPLTVVLSAGAVAAALNVYWVALRRRYER
ncbi:membrane protein [Streptomonospora alba]|uniref:Membrane protein n=2 Tax=Streptomonospora alba TaxID=183763 RepID=A0A0C2JJQ8_9ACTN|nr:membrane protein [Streptomonospora alba]